MNASEKWMNTMGKSLSGANGEISVPKYSKYQGKVPRIENKKTYHAPKETTQRFAPVIDLSLQIETCCHTICYHKPASQVICQNATLKPGAVVGDGAIVLPHCTVTGAGCAHKRKQILRNIISATWGKEAYRMG